MSVDVATYLAQLDNKKGKLERWETDIFQLHHAGVSYQNIADFLKLNGAESTKMEVYRFIHRKKRRHLLESKTDKSGESKTERVKAKAPVETPAEPQAVTPVTHQDESSRPKFKFKGSVAKDKNNW
jgi:hypothetical protein